MIKARGAVPADIEARRRRAARRCAPSIGREAYELNVQQFCCAGLNFGYFYDRSPIIAYDGERAAAVHDGRLHPSTVPGCRAPHFWLADGRSLYDALGSDYTLLRFDRRGRRRGRWRQPPRARGMPLTVLDVDRARMPARLPAPAGAVPRRPARGLARRRASRRMRRAGRAAARAGGARGSRRAVMHRLVLTRSACSALAWAGSCTRQRLARRARRGPRGDGQVAGAVAPRARRAARAPGRQSAPAVRGWPAAGARCRGRTGPCGTPIPCLDLDAAAQLRAALQRLLGDALGQRGARRQLHPFLVEQLIEGRGSCDLRADGRAEG